MHSARSIPGKHLLFSKLAQSVFLKLKKMNCHAAFYCRILVCSENGINVLSRIFFIQI